MLKELQQLKALKRKFQSETEALSRFDDDITLLSGKKERLSNAGKSYLERKQMVPVHIVFNRRNFIHLH
jgi:hypothetical protein